MTEDTREQTQHAGQAQTPAPKKQANGDGHAAEQGQKQPVARRGEQSRPSQDSPAFIPLADVFESKESFMVLLDMPGADPGSLDVTLDKHVLMVAAKSTPWRPEGYTLLAAEYQDGDYARSFILSDRVDENHIKAEFRNGVLRLNLPKAAPAPAKKIQVSAA